MDYATLSMFILYNFNLHSQLWWKHNDYVGSRPAFSRTVINVL